MAGISKADGRGRFFTTGKKLKPREYAIAYLKAKSKEAQKQALAGCPVEWQELVKAHIKNMRIKASLKNAAHVWREGDENGRD